MGASSQDDSFKLKKQRYKTEVLASNLYKFISPSFHSKTPAEQENLYADDAKVTRLGIPLKILRTFSKAFYNLEPNNLERLLGNRVKWVVQTQELDGCWPILTKDQLKSLSPEHSEALYQLSSDRIANSWSNSMLTLFLIKWYGYSINYCPGCLDTIEELYCVITKSKKWLLSCCTIYDEFAGWGKLDPCISSPINIYDTSFAFLVLSYDTGLSNNQATCEFASNKLASEIKLIQPAILRAITNETFREQGAWKAEANTALDTGATSYALLSLMKYVETASAIDGISELLSSIRAGAKWLIANQLHDGGWKEYRDVRSRSSIEKTCYAMMALIRYYEIFQDIIVGPCITAGEKFLKNNLQLANHDPLIHAWPSDNEAEPNACIKNSSLAVSTLLRCGVNVSDDVIQKGVVGIYELLTEQNDDSEIDDLVKIYSCCSLLDYLKVAL